MKKENIKLTDENYYSNDADKSYMSVSQYKRFAGTFGQDGCEAAALDELENPKPEELTTSMLIGSYVDNYFGGTLTMFCEEHKDVLFKKTGDKGLKAEFKKAEQIIERIESEDVLKAYLEGDKQTILTGELFGVDWKAKPDIVMPGERIVDLKIMKDMAPIWSNRHRTKIDFIRYWGYDIQGAVYQKLWEMNTGEKLPFYLLVGTKEDATDVALIEIEQPYLDEALRNIQKSLPSVIDAKSKARPARRCECCAFCKRSKHITGPVKMSAIIPAWLRDNNDYEEEE